MRLAGFAAAGPVRLALVRLALVRLAPICLTLVGLNLVGSAWSQPFQWPAAYMPTVVYGGVITAPERLPQSMDSFNPAVAEPDERLALYDAPPLVYRDWLGSRSYRRLDGTFNLFFAKEVEELALEQDFIVTLRRGWKWSDGTEITADDALTARLIQGDAKVQGNRFYCSNVDGEPVRYEKLGTYRYRITFPRPQVNALSSDCGFLPTHVFGPLYEAAGAAGVRSLWTGRVDPKSIVSGGPYVVSEIHPGERVVMARNPYYGDAVTAADGSPLPGPDAWVLVEVEDQNAALAAVLTGRLDMLHLTSQDEVRAVKSALERGNIEGKLEANLSPGTLVEFITYNFNHPDPCKRRLFRDVRFRQAVSLMIDREALVRAVYGGLGYPAKNFNSAAGAPFDAPHLGPLLLDPDRGVRLLHDMGFSTLSADGVLTDPDTGCRVAFELQYNSESERRAGLAQVIAQTLAPYGVRVNPRQVSTEMWAESITGDLPRKYDSEAILWGLTSGDLDNPSFSNGLRLATELNAWNKSKTEVEAWEVLMDTLTARMDETLNLDERVAIYNERATLMRDYLPLTPLVSPAVHFYHNLGNVWPREALDAFSLENNPGNFPANVTAP